MVVSPPRRNYLIAALVHTSRVWPEDRNPVEDGAPNGTPVTQGVPLSEFGWLSAPQD